MVLGADSLSSTGQTSEVDYKRLMKEMELFGIAPACLPARPPACPPACLGTNLAEQRRQQSPASDSHNRMAETEQAVPSRACRSDRAVSTTRSPRSTARRMSKTRWQPRWSNRRATRAKLCLSTALLRGRFRRSWRLASAAKSTLGRRPSSPASCPEASAKTSRAAPRCACNNLEALTCTLPG